MSRTRQPVEVEKSAVAGVDGPFVERARQLQAEVARIAADPDSALADGETPRVTVNGDRQGDA